MTDTITKTCNRCRETKPVAEFYKRSGTTNQYITECKTCMIERGKTSQRFEPLEPRAFTETLAINYLKSKGVPSLPGKAVKAADVDISCFGCLWIEAKYSRFDAEGTRTNPQFKFVTTAKQQQRGFLANLVLLICEYPDGSLTYHLFRPNHPAFYNHKTGKLKQGITFVPGRTEDNKHVEGRTVLTQMDMDTAQDALWMIDDELWQIRRKLMAGEVLPFERNTRKAS